MAGVATAVAAVRELDYLIFVAVFVFECFDVVFANHYISLCFFFAFKGNHAVAYIEVDGEWVKRITFDVLCKIRVYFALWSQLHDALGCGKVGFGV